MPEIRYEFIAVGHDGVRAAFRSIGDEAEAQTRRVEDAMKRIGKGGSPYRAPGGGATGAGRSSGGGGRRSTVDHELRDAQRMAAGIEREAKQATRALEREDAKRAAAAARSAATIRGAYVTAFTGIGRGSQEIGLGHFLGIKGIGALRGALTGIGSGIYKGMEGAVRESLKLDATVRRLAINARGAGEGFADTTAIRKEFEQVAIKTPGIKSQDLAEAAQGFVGKTGDLDAARKFSSTFATVASATGGDVKDVANAGAELFSKFDIKTVEQMQSAFTALTMQGKSGAFELRDMAAELPKIGAAARRFGLPKGAEGVAILGGFSQIAKTSVKDPRAAGTAVEAMFRQVVGQSGKLKGMGVSVFKKGSNETRDIRDIITETISKTGGSQPKLQKLFKDQGIRAISPLISAYNEASDATTGTKKEKDAAGVAAVREAIRKSVEAAGDWGEMLKDQAKAGEGLSERVEAAWERLKAVAGDELAPAFAAIAKSVADDPAILEGFKVAVGFAVVALGVLAKGLSALGNLYLSDQDKADSAAKQEEKAREGMKAILGKKDVGDLKPAALAEYRKLETQAVLAHAAKSAAEATAEEAIGATKDAKGNTVVNKQAETSVLEGLNYYFGGGGSESMDDDKARAEAAAAGRLPPTGGANAPTPTPGAAGGGGNAEGPAAHKAAAGALMSSASALSAAALKLADAQKPSVYSGSAAPTHQ